jgi:HEPN domain-containing protein
MPRDLPTAGSAEDWLRHAESDLALSSHPRFENVLTEMLCFHAQQAVEKSLKAALVHRGVTFPHTHDIAALVTAVRNAGIDWPDDLDEAVDLAEYAVAARYPGAHLGVSDDDLRTAVDLARRVLAWARASIQKS